MQDDNVRKITYGAMMTALFAILLAVSLYIPLIGFLTIFFIPLPIILYRLRYDRLASLLVMGTGTIMSLIIGGIIFVPVALVFSLLGFVIGETILLKKSKLYTLMASGLTLTTVSIILYVGAVLFFKFNFMDIILLELQNSQQLITSFLANYGELPEGYKEQMTASIVFYETAIPSIFIIGIFSLAFVVVSLNLLVVKRLGHAVESFPPFREMKLPLITVWYYLLVLFSGFIFDMEQGTTANLMYVNATVLLRFLFFLQGIALIHYFMNKLKVSKWLTVLLTLLALPLSPVITILGVLDTGFNVRAWVRKDKMK